MMNLSVVIPAYNEEKYLPATLEALNAAVASVKETEVVVVDNESTDSTRDIARRYGARTVDESDRCKHIEG